MYSIDESFVGLKGTRDELIDRCKEIRKEVFKATGVPVRIGIAPTKTLAKVAIMGAKKNPTFEGVCHFDVYESEHQDRILAGLHVTELWGVAGRTAKKLAAMGIFSAKELRDADPRQLRKSFSVVLARTVYELRRIPCIPLDEEGREYKDQMIFSRSFSRPVTNVEEMEQVLSIYAQKVSSRLRKEGQVAKTVSAWAQTGHYVESGWHSAHSSATLPAHTNEPINIAKAAGAFLSKIKPNTRYARAGVVLTDISPVSDLTPLDLFMPEFEGRKIGVTLDKINQKLGGNIVGVGRGGFQDTPAWNMRREMLSNRGTTHWDELVKVKAC